MPPGRQQQAWWDSPGAPEGPSWAGSSGSLVGQLPHSLLLRQGPGGQPRPLGGLPSWEEPSQAAPYSSYPWWRKASYSHLIPVSTAVGEGHLSPDLRQGARWGPLGVPGGLPILRTTASPSQAPWASPASPRAFWRSCGQQAAGALEWGFAEEDREGSMCTNTHLLHTTNSGSGTQNRMGHFQVPNWAGGGG